MPTVRVSGTPGLEQVDRWRAHARRLLAAGIAPADVHWIEGDAASLALDEPGDEPGDGSCAAAAAPALRLTRETLALFTRVGCHRAGERFAAMYEALWRIAHGRPHLFDLRHDPLVQRLQMLDAAVRREMHKTRAFVRFEPRALADGSEHWAAWFEPDHHALELVAPFFQRRFANMRWSILTPALCLHWDGAALHRAPGIPAPPPAEPDPLAAAWPIYYASTFNPNRLRVQTMSREMPRRYWRNLPEAQAIPSLIAQATVRRHAMLAAADTRSGEQSGAPDDVAGSPGDGTQRRPPSLAACDRCPHARHATGVVPGEGPDDAQIMLVGEQPGDQEDLQGRPFVGPAGALLDRTLAAAGLARERLYLTNAVKHFLWMPRGKRRIHKTPGQREWLACRDHLLEELGRVRPRVVVALGTTAASALLDGTGLQAERSTPLRLPNGTWLIVTWHPAYVLRRGAEDPGAAQALHDDLAAARRLAAGTIGDGHVG